MPVTAWQRTAVAVLGLSLLSLASQAPGGFEGSFCCQCLCAGELSCVGIPTPSECPSACPNKLNATCTFKVLPSPCGQFPNECPASQSAPTLGPGALTAAALALAALGTIVLRSRRRRRT